MLKSTITAVTTLLVAAVSMSQGLPTVNTGAVQAAAALAAKPPVTLPTVAEPPPTLVAVKAGPTFMIFSAPWCGPCQAMRANVYPKVNFSGYALREINGDEHPKLLQQFNVKSYPTLLVIDGDGHEMWRQAGSTDAETIKAVLAVCKPK